MSEEVNFDFGGMDSDFDLDGSSLDNGNQEITLEDLISYGVSKGASDLHIKEGEPPVCRIEGRMVRIGNTKKLDDDDVLSLLQSCIDDEHLNIFNKEKQVDFAYTNFDGTRLRCNAFKENGRTGIVFRILKEGVPNLADLEVPSALYKIAQLTSGLVLVTGPTGSGKTTTLAGILNEINLNQQKHIITLEDPIEYTYTSNSSIVRQREIGRDVATFADGLRAALREDPDVILVGELRDLESISIALTAAETGHLVFGTLHTLGAAKTIDRLVDVFSSAQQQQVRVQLSGVLRAIISQKLIKRVDKAGRIAAFEIMLATPSVAAMVRDGKWAGIDNAIQTGANVGMISLNRHLAQLVSEGKITRELAFNASNNVEDLKSII